MTSLGTGTSITKFPFVSGIFFTTRRAIMLLRTFCQWLVPENPGVVGSCDCAGGYE